MKRTLKQASLSGGENSKDEPHSIGENQCKSLVNMYPGSYSPLTRNGTDTFNTNAWGGEVRELIAWSDAIDGDKVIGIIDDDIKFMDKGTGAVTTIMSTAFTNATALVSHFRYQNSLFITTDSGVATDNHIIEWDRTALDFTIRNTNIARQTQTFVIDTDTTDSFMEARKFYGVAFTYSRRTDADAVDVSLDPQTTVLHHTGVNESPDDIDQRLFIKTGGSDNQWFDIAFGNGLFVAVAQSGTGNRVLTSPDGITWTSRASAADNSWNAITFGNGLFVAVSISGTGNRVMTSPDGITWTIRVSAADNAWEGVAFGDGLFVAVSTSGTGNRAMTSPDGITWTIRVSAADNAWRSVSFGNGVFAAVSTTGTGNRVMTSPDGITWTIRVSAADKGWFSVEYSNGLFVAVSLSGSTNRVMTSPDGITWTSRASASDKGWTSVTSGDGLFVAVAQDGASEQVMTSPDGITWTDRVTSDDRDWIGITFGNGIFVAVSSNGLGRVMTSPDGITWTTRTTDVIADTLKVTLNSGLSMSDSQITHINFYRTNGNDTLTEAEGAVFRFAKSVPVSGPNSELLSLPFDVILDDSDATLLGQTNTVAEMVGVSPMQSSSAIFNYLGLTWTGGLNTSDTDRGRWFYSVVIGDVQNPLKYFGLFRFTDRFIELSQDDSEDNIGVGLSQNDLCFVLSETIWFLRDGDPDIFAPQQISRTRGSKFPKSLVSIDKSLHYLSNEGPAAIFGRNVEIINAFTAKEVWPRNFDSIGLFHTLGITGLGNTNANKKDVISFYYKNTWFMGWKDALPGLYIAPDKQSLGVWRVEFGDSDLRASKVAVFNNNSAVFSKRSNTILDGSADVGTVDRVPYNFLSDGIHLDKSSTFTIKMTSKAFYTNQAKRDMFGEADSLQLYCNFTDTGSLHVNVISDFVRYTNRFEYVQRSKTNQLQNQSINNDGVVTPWRATTQQFFPEGIVGNTFEIKFEKDFLAPFDFIFKGFDFVYILRPSYQPEFVSTSAQNSLGIGSWSIDTDAGLGIFTVRGDL